MLQWCCTCISVSSDCAKFSNQRESCRMEMGLGVTLSTSSVSVLSSASTQNKFLKSSHVYPMCPSVKFNHKLVVASPAQASHFHPSCGILFPFWSCTKFFATLLSFKVPSMGFTASLCSWEFALIMASAASLTWVLWRWFHQSKIPSEGGLDLGTGTFDCLEELQFRNCILFQKCPPSMPTLQKIRI